MGASEFVMLPLGAPAPDFVRHSSESIAEFAWQTAELAAAEQPSWLMFGRGRCDGAPLVRIEGRQGP